MSDNFDFENHAQKIYAPLSGTARDITEMPDPMFSQKILGDGVSIEPEEGRVYSPFDGIISLVADTKHAIGIEDKNGTVILIHIGTDTVKLAGELFEPRVLQGDRVEKGALIMDFDIDELRRRGFMTVTAVIVMSDSRIKDIKKMTGRIKACESLLMEYKI